MNRHLLNLLLLPSLVLWSASLGLWVRCGYASDWWMYSWKQQVRSPRLPWKAESWWAISTRGTIAVGKTTLDVNTHGLFQIVPGPTPGFEHIAVDPSIRALPRVAPDQQGVLNPFGFRADVAVSDSSKVREVHWIVAVPYWFIAAAAAVPPVTAFVRRRRWWTDGVRRASGRCVGCGYDLRATPGRCPVCGLNASATIALPSAA